MSPWRHRLKNDTETPIIQHIGNELGIKYTPLSKFMIHQMINDSKTNLKRIQKNARVLRQEHLEALATEYGLQNNVSKQTAITELISHEETRETFKVLRQRLKPIQRGQLQTLWVSTNDQGEFTKDTENKQILTKRDDIHAALLNRNARHLEQASETPFGKGSLRKHLKWDGTGILAERMISGDILNDRIFRPAMQLYLESIRVKDLTQLNIVRPRIHLEDYANFWKKKRENTVTSPYGLHVGHYKAAITKPSILEVHRKLLLIPFQTGMVPVRWRKTVQTMIEKEPGAPWIHRLRIIELFDAQANAGFQIFVGRHMMRHAVNKGLLSDASFGSTPGKMAVSAIIQKLVCVDQLRIERRAGGLFDCDASGCYDRILPPLASVHLQALGLQKSIGTLLARLMYQAKRYVRTKHGVSKGNIRTTKSNTLHGIGQGNGGGPAMWISHLTVMFVALTSVCWGFVLTCVENLQRATTVGTGYVDDVTLGLSVPREQTQTENMVQRQIQRMGQLWERLLHITGGRLELSKCFWVPITWKWKKGIPSLVLKQKRNRGVVIQESETKDYITIPRKTGKESEKQLGVWSSCDGLWTKEVKLWQEFSTALGIKVKQSRLGRRAGLLAYKTMWLAKFRYSAPVIGYTIAQLEKVQKMILSPCLSASGYCCKMPRAVVHGPPEWGGMDWDNCGVVLLYEKLKVLIGSIRLQDKVGELLFMQLSWLQLFAGTSVPLLKSNKAISYLPRGWLTTIHHHLVYHNVKVEVWGLWKPTVQRTNDRVIMDVVQTHFPQWMWGGINRCRLYLRANTITDIVTIGGTYIPLEIREVQEPIRDNRLLFPIQQKPSKSDITYWQHFINYISDNGHLHVSLEEWKRRPDQLFPFMINQSMDIIYKSTKHEWHVYGKQTRTSRRFVKMKVTVNSIPDNCIPVKVIAASSYLILLSEIDLTIPITNPDVLVTESNTQAYLEQVIGQYTVDDNILESFHQKWHTLDNRLICATDGGLKDSIGTSSYGFFLPDNNQAMIAGFSGEYQPSQSASSTRQELLGQLAVEYWIKRLQKRWGVPRNGLTVTLVTDSQSSIDIMDKISGASSIRDMLNPEMDVALEIYQQRLLKPWVLVEIVKVQSHIELSQAPDEFFWHCNLLADQMATNARNIYTIETVKQQEMHLFPAARAAIRINDRIENNNLYMRLKEDINGQVMKNYLLEKYSWTNELFSSIDWVAYGRAFKKLKPQRKPTVVKYIHGWLATNKRQYFNGKKLTNTCVLCGQEEHRKHLFQCTNDRVTQLRDQRVKKLIMDLIKDTAQGFQQIFCIGLQTVLDNKDQIPDAFVEWPGELQKVYSIQAQIGWENVFYGRIAKQWEQFSQYKSNSDHADTNSLWTSKSIQLFWDFGIDLWIIRNNLVHGGNGTGPSQEEVERIDTLVQAVSTDLQLPNCRLMRELFSAGKNDTRQLSLDNKRAWLEQVKYRYPVEYKEIAERAVGRLNTVNEEEMQKLRMTGTTLNQGTL